MAGQTKVERKPLAKKMKVERKPVAGQMKVEVNQLSVGMSQAIILSGGQGVRSNTLGLRLVLPAK